MLPTRFADLLRVLDRHRVDHVVVGGVAAVLVGAIVATEDLDVVFARTSDNVDRLLGALAEMDASYLDPASRRIRPDRDRLLANRVNLLDTSLGRLDVLSTVADDLDYDSLLPLSQLLDVEGLAVRVLGLEALIDSKEKAGRPKDQLHLMVLREALRLSRLRGG